MMWHSELTIPEPEEGAPLWSDPGEHPGPAEVADPERLPELAGDVRGAEPTPFQPGHPAG